MASFDDDDNAHDSKEDLKKILSRIEERLKRLENASVIPPIEGEGTFPFESKKERSGGDLWQGITDNFKCANCNKPFSNDAALDRGKHPIVNISKRRIDMFCNECYAWWRERKDPDKTKFR